MTQAEFLKKLAAKTKRLKPHWQLRGAAVRCEWGCPLQFVDGKGSGHIASGIRLGLRTDTLIKIAGAADVKNHPLRNRLLKAVGLAALVLCFASPAFAHRTEKPDIKTPEVKTPEVRTPADTTVPQGYTAPSQPIRRPVVVAPVYPPVFRVMPITTHLTHNGPPIVLVVIRGKPKVSTFSTCAERGLPLTCRYTPAPRPRTVDTVKPKPKPVLRLPAGL